MEKEEAGPIAVRVRVAGAWRTRVSWCRGAECPGRKKCKACRNAEARATRPKHSELTDEQRQRANCRSYANVYQRMGVLVPKPCEVCGDEKVEKHHDDYSKPLQVRWLCKQHHREAEKKKGAS